MLGYLLVLHCIYSSYEYNQLNVSLYNQSDLILELIIGLGLVFISATNGILNHDNLTVDNQVVEHHAYLQPIKINEALHQLDQVPNDYMKYDNKVDFMDLSKLRGEYQNYIDSQ